MNKNATVSIIMPTYNCARYIESAIQSVIDQTFTDWNLYIVDDCSTDNTETIVKQYTEKYKNIYYFKLENNSGPAVARTEAIRKADGKYIAFLDSDDLWNYEKLEKQIDFMEDNQYLFSATGYSLMNEEGNSLNKTIYPPEKVDYNKCIRLSNPLGNLTVMYNQEVLGKFEVPNIKKRNDFALWLQILKKTEYCYGLQDSLGMYRKGRADSVSHNKLKQAKYHWQLYRNIEKHSILQSGFEVMCWAFVKATGIGIKKR